MKALTYTLSLLLSASLLSGCTQNQHAQQEYDDMYYTAQDRQRAVEEEQAREQARLEARKQREADLQRQRELAEAERRRSAYDKNDVQTGREINPDASTGYAQYEDEYYEEDSQEQYYDNQQRGRSSEGQTVYNNHYYNSGAFNNPWAYDPFWHAYSARPWGWNTGFSINIGWNSWNNWCDPFFDPWCGGSGYYYNAYRPVWASNGWGYHNNYARGYHDGFYDGYWRRNYWGSYYPSNTVIIYNNGDNTRSGRNVSYGPRSTRTMAVADMGVGTRISTRQQMEGTRRQRSIDQNAISPRGEGQRTISPDGRRERAYPTERGTRNTERPSVRPRAPRTEPSRSGDNARPGREPQERTRPSRPAPSERPSRPAPTPSERPSRPAPSERPSRPAPSNDGGSRPSRDNGGGSSPSRSRGRGGEAPLQSSFDGNQRQEPAQRTSTEEYSRPLERPAYQPTEQRQLRTPQQAAEPRERSNRYNQQAQQQEQTMERPAYRPELNEAPARSEAPAVERNTYNRPQPQQRNTEERQYSRPQFRDNYSRPQAAPAYSAPRPAPQERSAPARSFGSPVPSRPAPAFNNSSSPSRSSSPARSSSSSEGSRSSSRSRGGN